MIGGQLPIVIPTLLFHRKDDRGGDHNNGGDSRDDDDARRSCDTQSPAVDSTVVHNCGDNFYDVDTSGISCVCDDDDK